MKMPTSIFLVAILTAQAAPPPPDIAAGSVRPVPAQPFSPPAALPVPEQSAASADDGQTAPPPPALPSGLPPPKTGDLPPVSPRAAIGQVPPALAGIKRQVLAFTPGSDSLDDAARERLRDIARRLQARPAERLELRAYASAAGEGEAAARRLSLARALAIRQQLTQWGVVQDRLVVFALGSRTPADDPPGSDVDRADLSFLTAE